MPTRFKATAGRERTVPRYGFAFLMLTAAATTSAQEGIPPALPGRHIWTVNWRTAAGAGVVTRSPAVALSAPASNLHARGKLS